ncbi:DUF4180 domain-containing protein [bacterium]|nr:DUF4180 domain-containing protein [bacterium]
MIIYHNSGTSAQVAELKKGTLSISSAEEMLDLIGEVSYAGCSRLIIHSGSLSEDFFDLRTGVAGEMLQKFSNYRMRLAVVGDFSHLAGRSWRDFIRESNRGKTVCFLNTVDEALSALIK